MILKIQLIMNYLLMEYALKIVNIVMQIITVLNVELVITMLVQRIVKK